MLVTFRGKRGKSKLRYIFASIVEVHWPHGLTPDRVVQVQALARVVVFLGKTLHSHSASLHPGVQMGTSKYAGGNPAMD